MSRSSDKIPGFGKYCHSALICRDANVAFNKLLEHTGLSYKDIAEKAGIKERKAYALKNSSGGMSFDTYEKICDAFPEFDGIARSVAQYGVATREDSEEYRVLRNELSKQSKRMKLMLRCLEIDKIDLSASTGLDFADISSYVDGEYIIPREDAEEICKAVNDFSGKRPIFPVDWICGE